MRVARKRVLIADDEPQTCRLHAEALGEAYEIFVAHNGVDALVLAVDLVPDLLLLDIMMPQLDGRTICRKLKSYPRTKDIKIVLVTGKSAQSDRIVGFEVGADEYLEKPVPLQRLALVVANLLR